MSFSLEASSPVASLRLVALDSAMLGLLGVYRVDDFVELEALCFGSSEVWLWKVKSFAFPSQCRIHEYSASSHESCCSSLFRRDFGNSTNHLDWSNGMRFTSGA